VVYEIPSRVLFTLLKVLGFIYGFIMFSKFKVCKCVVLLLLPQSRSCDGPNLHPATQSYMSIIPSFILNSEAHQTKMSSSKKY
jgi:hypothetical protein